MSVYPEFLQYIHDEGLYVYGYNYEHMYNLMVYNLTYDIIPTTNFIYTYQQVNQLYTYLEELLTPMDDSDPDTNETNEPNQDNQIINNNTIITIEHPDNFDDIYEVVEENEVELVQPVPEVTEPEYTQNQTDAQLALNNYIQIIINAANIDHTNQINTNQMNQMNTTQMYYTNLTYYNNTQNYPHNI